MYQVGVIRALNSVNQFFPGAKVIVFNEDNAPNVEDKFCWRLMASEKDFPGVTHFLYRDADSRITMREYFAVLEWLASKKAFHFMRDHPAHFHPVLGGMWGHQKGWFHPEIVRTWFKLESNVGKTGYGVNELLLEQMVWPMAKLLCLEHGSFNKDKYPNQIPFPTDRFNIPTVGFVGEKLDANDVANEEHRASRVVACV